MLKTLSDVVYKFLKHFCYQEGRNRDVQLFLISINALIEYEKEKLTLF